MVPRWNTRCILDDGRRIAVAPPKSAILGRSLMQGAITSAPIDLASPNNPWSRCCHRLSVSAHGDICVDGVAVDVDGENCKVAGGPGAIFR